MDILPQVIINSLITGSIYALVGSGLALIYSIFRFLNFSHGQLLVVGAYTYYFWNVVCENPPLSAFFFTVACAVILALITFSIFIEPFLKGNPLLPLISTIALAILLEAGISMIFGVNVRSLPTDNNQSLSILTANITPLQILTIALAVGILILMALIIKRTPVGRKIRAISELSEGVSAVGNDPRFIGVVCYIFSTILAFIAGIAVAYDTNISPTMGSSLTIKAFAAMVLGGLGNIWGTILGSYVLGFVENFIVTFDWYGFSLPAGYRDAVSFLVILGVLLLRPSGIAGTWRRKV